VKYRLSSRDGAEVRFSACGWFRSVTTNHEWLAWVACRFETLKQAFDVYCPYLAATMFV
jgi:hypothetical protein